MKGMESAQRWWLSVIFIKLARKRKQTLKLYLWKLNLVGWKRKRKKKVSGGGETDYG